MTTLKTADTPTTTPAHEDSHMFSLESLRAREAAATRARSPGASESGVIDLDAVRMAGPGSLQGLAAPATRLLTPETAEPPRASTPRWAIGTLAVLGGAVAALGALVALGLPHGTTATQDPAPAPTMAAAAVLDVSDDTLSRVGGLEMGAIIPDAAAPPPAPEPAVTAAPEPPSKAKPKAKSTRKRSATRAKATKPAASPKPKATTPASKAKPKTSSEPSVACILDPASCGLGKAPKAKPKTQAPTTSLPEKLSSSQIRTAMTGPKAKAKQCRDMHAAPAGTKVSVKLSIAGSGTVVSATPQSPPSAALGRCVADALSTAKFPRFSKTAMGVVYSVRL